MNPLPWITKLRLPRSEKKGRRGMKRWSRGNIWSEVVSLGHISGGGGSITTKKINTIGARII